MPSGTLFSTYTLLGRPGEYYKAFPDEDAPIRYEYDSVEGDPEGTFSDEDAVVNFKYRRFIPSSLTPEFGDVDDDSEITILDGTVLQKYLASLVRLDEEHQKRGATVMFVFKKRARSNKAEMASAVFKSSSMAALNCSVNLSS